LARVDVHRVSLEETCGGAVPMTPDLSGPARVYGRPWIFLVVLFCYTTVNVGASGSPLAVDLKTGIHDPFTILTYSKPKLLSFITDVPVSGASLSMKRPFY